MGFILLELFLEGVGVFVIGGGPWLSFFDGWGRFSFFLKLSNCHVSLNLIFCESPLGEFLLDFVDMVLGEALIEVEIAMIFTDLSSVWLNDYLSAKKA